MKASERIWFDGKFVPWDDAKIHVAAHSLQYGSSVFEGIRCYETQEGPAAFCLSRHIRRLQDSCQIFRMALPYSAEQLSKACLETVSTNDHQSCYIRPLVFRGVESWSVEPRRSPLHMAIMTIEWGRVPRSRGHRAGCRRHGEFVAAHGARHAPGHGQDRRATTSTRRSS